MCSNETLNICQLPVDSITASKLGVGYAASEQVAAASEGGTEADCVSQLNSALQVCSVQPGTAVPDQAACCDAMAGLGPSCLASVESLVVSTADVTSDL